MEKTIIEDAKPKRAGVQKRNILWWLVFVGFAVNYMIRINLNIAIVSMVQSKPQLNLNLTSECAIEYTVQRVKRNSTGFELKYDNDDKNGSYFYARNHTDGQTEERETTLEGNGSLFQWNEQEQANVLGAFYWLYWLMQIPGGMLAAKYGTKLIFGAANFLGVLCSFLIPVAANLGINYLMAIRIFQGLLCGATWPSMHNMAARWIPPNERSNFVTAYMGCSIGTALTYLVAGYLIDQWGWEMVFHLSGVLGTLWYVAWLFLVYDNPADHPTISDEEKNYILDSLSEGYTKEQEPVPWKHLLTSLPIWMILVSQFGGFWGFFTLITHTPTYFKFVLGWDVKATGLLSGMPHVIRMVWALACSASADYLLRTGKMGRTNVRKLATSFCTIALGIFMLALAYSGCNRLWAGIFMTAAVVMNGSFSTGPLACIVDISPNYASVIAGFVNSAVALTGFIAPVVVGYLTLDNQTIGQWQKVFWISAFMSISTGVIYAIFGDATQQEWNSPGRLRKETELVSLKTERTKDHQHGYEKVSPNDY